MGPATAAAAAVPRQVLSRMKGGRFDPGDFSFLRGRFPGESPEQVRDWRAIDAYATRCMAAAAEKVRGELQREGASAAGVTPQPYGDTTCGDVVYAISVAAAFDDWHRFAAKLSLAQPLVGSFLFGVTAGQAASAEYSSETLADELRRRASVDASLRTGAGWGAGAAAAAAPRVDEETRTIVAALITLEVRRRDTENRLWLETIVARRGWPRISEVGRPAAAAAWLLVQHADDDPPFQLRALRLMEKLVSAGDVEPEKFAFLWDRAHLRAEGMQLYGTQTRCDAGRRVAAGTLKDPAGVDARRSKLGMPTFKDNLRRLDRLYGACRRAPD
jgi:hypothetical protein